MRFRRIYTLAIFLILSIFFAVFACAQITQAPGTATAESLLIGPGDMLHIQVFDTPELEQHARVTDAGNVPLVFLGNVQIAGQTPEAAARSIEAELVQKGYMKKPHVTVNIETFSTQGVLVIGQVVHPGPYLIDTPRSVLDVLGMAGGLTDLADRKITVERHGTGERLQYFVSNNPEEIFSHSLMIHPADKIVVSRAGVVYAIGDFARPGGFVMSNNKGQLTALQMLALAGGTPSSAVPSHARLIRRTGGGDSFTETRIQLSDMQKGKIPDITLQPEDILYVPFSYLKNIATNSSQILAAAGAAAVYAVP
jgi:polysaccharide biosynthesis/export protein